MNAYRFKIPFKRPLVLLGVTHTFREGILLERDGMWAEASPLPGLSHESIDDVVAALRGEQATPVASLNFALDGLRQPWNSEVRVPINDLLIGNRQEVLAGVKVCLKGRSRVVKLKVGRNKIEDEVATVTMVRERLPQDVGIRLDANQAWSLEEAMWFCQEIAPFEIEYIEEPLQDPLQLEELYSKTGVRYALDETLLRENSIQTWPNSAAFICKPTILGGRTVIERLAATRKPLVFSSAFESGVGVARIMQWVAEFAPDVPAGLDTLDWLSDDQLVHSPEKRDGWMSLGTLDVRDEGLERVEL